MPPGTAASAPDRETAAPAGDTWVGITASPLDAAALGRWATTPDVGAVVTFAGTVRDHAPGRDGVTALTYEAYEETAVARLADVVADARRRWPEVRRVAAIHRTGRLEVGEAAVVVAVGAPHRGSSFAAAAHCIDTLKATVPLWKKETWAGGEEWGTDATQIEDVAGAVTRTPDGAVGPAAAPEAREGSASPSSAVTVSAKPTPSGRWVGTADVLRASAGMTAAAPRRPADDARGEL